MDDYSDALDGVINKSIAPAADWIDRGHGS